VFFILQKVAGMHSERQLEFPYASLDFPEQKRKTVKVSEIAERTGYSANHILNLIDSGAITAMDAKGVGASRKCIRVPIEEYRAWILRSLTGPASTRSEFLDTLPKLVLIALHDEISQRISAA
jgi:hypothetical protein